MTKGHSAGRPPNGLRGSKRLSPLPTSSMALPCISTRYRHRTQLTESNAGDSCTIGLPNPPSARGRGLNMKTSQTKNIFNDTAALDSSQDTLEDTATVEDVPLGSNLQEIDVIFIIGFISVFLLIVAVVCR